MRKLTIICFSLWMFQTSLFAQESLGMTDRDAHYKKGTELLESKQLLAARKEFECFLSEFKPAHQIAEYLKVSNANYYIGAIAVDLHQPDAEKILLDYIHNFHETSLRRLAYYQLGKWYNQEGKYDESIVWFEKVTKKDLSNQQRTAYSFKLGYAYFLNKEFDKAKPLFKEVKSFENIYQNDANYYYGYISFSEGEYTAAQTSFETIQSIDHYKNLVPYYLAQIYFMKKNYDKVIAYTEPYLKDNSLKYQSEIQYIVGQSYYYKQDYAKAAPLLKSYIDKTPKVKKESIYQLAFTQYKIGNYADAIKNFKQLNVVEDSLGQNSFYTLANCYLKIGETDNAKTAFAQAARMDFDQSIKEIAAANYIKLSYESEDFSTVVVQAPVFLNTFTKSTEADDITVILATSLLQTKNYKEAIRVIESTKNKNAVLNKAYQQVTYYQSVAVFNDKDYGESLLLLNKSLSFPLDKNIQGEALFLKGEIYYISNDYPKAILEFGKYLQIANIEKIGNANTNAFKAYYGQGYAYLKQKQYLAAIQPFQNAVNAYGQSQTNDKSALYDAYTRLADCQYMTKDLNNAANNYQKVWNESSSNKDYTLFQLSMIQGFQKKYGDKVTNLKNLVSNYPNSAYAENALYEIGITQQQDLEDPQSALLSYSQLTKNYPSSKYRADALMHIGLINFNLGNNEKAMTYYKEVVTNYPKSEEQKDALSIIQEIYVDMGNPSGYIEYLNQIGYDISTSVQDSLYFRPGEDRYMSSDYNNAITSLESYVSKFPTGFFALKAQYYLGDSYFKLNKYNEAVEHYDIVVSNGPSSYYEKALNRAALLCFQSLKDYEKARRFYALLYELNKNKTDEFGMLMNVLRSSYLSKSDNDVIKYADLMVINSTASATDKLEARYYKASVLLDKSDWDNALFEYTEVASGKVSEQTAESNYYLAYLLNKKGLFQNSLDKAFEVKEKVEGYDYWLAKLFILIGDNYAALQDFYQAKATYESILENYKGDKDLIEEAKNKLQQAKDAELLKSKIDISNGTETKIEVEKIETPNP